MNKRQRKKNTKKLGWNLNAHQLLMLDAMGRGARFYKGRLVWKTHEDAV